MGPADQSKVRSDRGGRPRFADCSHSPAPLRAERPGRTSRSRRYNRDLIASSLAFQCAYLAFGSEVQIVNLRPSGSVTSLMSPASVPSLAATAFTVTVSPAFSP